MTGVAGCPVCARLPEAAPVSAIAYPPPLAPDERAATDRIRGVLLGAAIGDGLGDLVHRGLAEAGGPPAPRSLAVGGATQLALLTAEGLIWMALRYADKGIGPAFRLVRAAIERWAFIQNDPVAHVFGPPHAGWPSGWLVREHALHRRVSGFGATRAALRTTIETDADVFARRLARQPVNASDGAGGLVRSYPAGLLFSAGEGFRVGATVAAMTHGAPAGYLAAGALSRIVAGLVRGDELEPAIDAARAELGEWEAHEAVAPALAAIDASGAIDDRREPDAVRALRLGIDAVRRAPTDPLGATRAAVRDGGTSAAVVAGAIAGGRGGASAFDAAWRAAPAPGAAIDELAAALAIAHRVFAMGRPLVGIPPTSTGSEPISDLLRPRFAVS